MLLAPESIKFLNNWLIERLMRQTISAFFHQNKRILKERSKMVSLTPKSKAKTISEMVYVNMESE